MSAVSVASCDARIRAYVFPEANAIGAVEQPQYVYGVSFSAYELWGETAEPNESTQVDVWESHLEPA